MTTGVFKYSLISSVVIVAAVSGVWYFVAPPEEAPAMPGRIEGDTIYPSEGVPAQTVCAESVADGVERCTQTRGSGLEYNPSDTAWSIAVPAGAYEVYARLTDPSEIGSDFGSFRAYYTEFVRCGLDVGCTDHSKIPVVVESGETVRDIQPYDWYAR